MSDQSVHIEEEGWVPIGLATYERLKAQYERPHPDKIDLRGLLGQMDIQRFLRETRKVRMHQPRLNNAPVLLDDHHLAALHQEAVKRYGMDPETSIVGAHLFGHELTQANE